MTEQRQDILLGAAFAALGAEMPSSQFFFGVTEPICFVGMLFIYAAFFGWMAGDRPLVPLKDPRLGEALNFKVH